MNSRLSLLLTAVLFVSPVFADDVVQNQAATEQNSQTTNNTKDVTKEEPKKEEAANKTADATKEEPKKEDATNQTTDNNVASTDNNKVATTVVTTEVTPQAKAGIFAAITVFAAARRDNVFNALDAVAAYSINPVLTKVADVCGCAAEGSKFRSNIPAINKVVVSAAIAALGYAAYKAYVAQQNADEDFDADFDADNN
jgi:hypothetical protein